MAGRKMGSDAGYGDDAGFGWGIQVASGLVEVDQVAPISLRWDAALGRALIDKVHPCRSYVTPDLKAFADQRMGLGGRKVVGTGGVEREGNAVGMAPGLLDLVPKSGFNGLNEKAVAGHGDEQTAKQQAASAHRVSPASGLGSGRAPAPKTGRAPCLGPVRRAAPFWARSAARRVA